MINSDLQLLKLWFWCLYNRCHVNTFPWIVWRDGLFSGSCSVISILVKVKHLIYGSKHYIMDGSSHYSEMKYYTFIPTFKVILKALRGWLITTSISLFLFCHLGVTFLIPIFCFHSGTIKEFQKSRIAAMLLFKIRKCLFNLFQFCISFFLLQLMNLALFQEHCSSGAKKVSADGVEGTCNDTYRSARSFGSQGLVCFHGSVIRTRRSVLVAQALRQPTAKASKEW